MQIKEIFKKDKDIDDLCKKIQELNQNCEELHLEKLQLLHQINLQKPLVQLSKEKAEENMALKVENENLKKELEALKKAQEKKR